MLSLNNHHCMSHFIKLKLKQHGYLRKQNHTTILLTLAHSPKLKEVQIKARGIRKEKHASLKSFPNSGIMLCYEFSFPFCFPS